VESAAVDTPWDTAARFTGEGVERGGGVGIGETPSSATARADGCGGGASGGEAGLLLTACLVASVLLLCDAGTGACRAAAVALAWSRPGEGTERAGVARGDCAGCGLPAGIGLSVAPG